MTMRVPGDRGLLRVRATEDFRHDGRLVRAGEPLLLHPPEAHALLARRLVADAEQRDAGPIYRALR